MTPQAGINGAVLYLLLLALCCHGAESTVGDASPWPVWDGQESIQEYAERAALDATKVLDLGNGLSMHFVLIPAGRFVRGVERPPRLDDVGYVTDLMLGKMLCVVCIIVVLGMSIVGLLRADEEGRRFQFSLKAGLIALLLISLSMYGLFYFFEKESQYRKAEADYEQAWRRYSPAPGKALPAHSVVITRPFYMGMFEVTRNEYAGVLHNSPMVPTSANLPIDEVSWDDAQTFCARMSRQTGAHIRLPRDAEWEYACRAGTRSTFASGDDESDLLRMGWLVYNAAGKTHPRGLRSANAWGLWDMHGNVWEWCEDRFGYYTHDEQVDPQGPEQGHERVIRGGSATSQPQECASANREPKRPDAKECFIGFRVVLDIPFRTH